MRGHRTEINRNRSYVAEPLEIQLDRMTIEKTPIEATGVPMIYTERGEGIKPEYNIRTDRWEIAQHAMKHVNKSAIAKRNLGSDTGKSTDGTPSSGEPAA